MNGKNPHSFSRVRFSPSDGVLPLIADRGNETVHGIVRIACLAVFAASFPVPCDAKDAVDLSFSTERKTHPSKPDGVEVDWGTGFATLAGERYREGKKRGSFEAEGPSWSRGFSGEFKMGEDFGALGTGMIRLKIDYAKRGSAIGSLLTRKSKSLDRELSIGIASPSGLSTSLLSFDRGGWSLADTVDFARRAANGEGRARSGFGWQVGGRLGGDYKNGSWGLQAERSRSPGLAAESRAMLSATIGF